MTNKDRDMLDFIATSARQTITKLKMMYFKGSDRILSEQLEILEWAEAKKAEGNTPKIHHRHLKQ